jgi:hypothetical protein
MFTPISTSDFTETAQTIAGLSYGLVVVNGPKSSGKSSLLNLVESIMGDAEDTGDYYKLAKADGRAAGGIFQLVDMTEIDPLDDDSDEYTAAQIASLLQWQRKFETLMRFIGYRALIIEDIETTGSIAKYLVEKSIDLALTGTLVVLTIDSTTPESQGIVEFLQDKAEKTSWLNSFLVDLSLIPEPL